MLLCTYVDNETGSEIHIPKATNDDANLETIPSRNNEKHPKIYEEHSKLLMILAVVFFVTSVIATTISVILACKLCGQKKNNINGMNITVNAV